MADYDTPLRLIELTYDTGALQLARTEAIMRSVGAGTAPPTLRLYSWSEPVAIIGVGQSISDIDLDACRRHGYRVLRRIGGGTAVYHDHDEVSIDLIVPMGHRLAHRDVHAGYEQFAEFQQVALREMGVPVDTVTVQEARGQTVDDDMRPICFAALSPSEFTVEGQKLNGVCQIRRRDVITYQSAIYRRFKITPLLRSLHHRSPALIDDRRQRLEHAVTDLASIRGVEFDFNEFQTYLADAAKDVFQIDAQPGQLSSDEVNDASALVADKYASDDWIHRR